MLPQRSGPRPATRQGLPHSQLDQQPANDQLRDALACRVFALPGVTEGPTGISVPGARALILDPALAAGPRVSFFVGTEFAHLHPDADHSLHVCIPEALADEACRAGWAEPHPLVATGELPPTVVMLYAPRDEAELEIIAGLVEASHRFATGHYVDSTRAADA